MINVGASDAMCILFSAVVVVMLLYVLVFVESLRFAEVLPYSATNYRIGYCVILNANLSSAFGLRTTLICSFCSGSLPL